VQRLTGREKSLLGFEAFPPTRRVGAAETIARRRDISAAAMYPALQSQPATIVERLGAVWLAEAG
jgi:hypothetical protein